MSGYGCSFPVETIKERSVLQEKIKYWMQLPFIALDTEFLRVDTFHPIPGLIQICDDTGVYLIDPIEITDLTILKPLLLGETIKVMHSMSEDVVLFQRISDCIPENIFDTQVACALLGQGISLSYQNFIERYLGLVIDKGETRSDWTKRPLSDSQLEYAAKDVHYLYEVYPQIKETLDDRGFSEVVQQECTLTNKSVLASSEDFESYYLKFRGGWKLPLSGQAMLKALSTWREFEARKKDKPRGRIVSDKQLLEIVELLPNTSNALQASKILNHGQFRQYGAYIVNTITALLSESPDIPRIPRPLNGVKLDFYRLLKKAAERIALDKEITPELLGKKRLIEGFIQDAYNKKNSGGVVELPETLGEWRIKLLNQAFKEATASHFNE
jgi:ribonuclease D